MPRTCKLLLFLLWFPALVALVGCGVTASGDFGIALDNATYTLAPGSATRISVTVSGSNGFGAAVAVSITGLPSGVTASPATLDITPGATQQVTLTASSTAAAGSATLTFTGTSGSLSHTATATLTISAATPPPPSPDFTLAVSPAALSINAGSSGQVTLSATAQNGFADTISVSLAGLPSGVTASPSTISLTPGTPQQITLTASSTAAAANANVQFTGASGTLSHTASLALTVATSSGGGGGSQPDFSLTLAPPSLSVTAGSSSQTAIAVTSSGGFGGNVNITMSGLPTGITATPAATQVAPGAPQTIQFSAASSAQAGQAVISITGTAGALTHTIQLTLTVTAGAAAPDFALSLNPASTSVTAGAAVQIALTATAINGFNGQVQTVITGLPTGATASPAAPVLTPGLPQYVTISLPANTPTGPAAVTFKGTAGTLTHTVTLALNVTAPPPPADFSLAISPSSASLQQGGTQAVSISAAAAGGFGGSVAIAITGLPSGVTVAPSSFSLMPGVPQSLTLTATASATLGAATVTFTGTSGSLTHTVTLALTVTQGQPVGDFTLSVTPGTAGLTPGQTGGTVSVLATAQNGFTGTVAVDLSGLPTGVTASPATLSLTPGQAQTVSFTAISTAPTGTYTITFTGTDSSLTHTATLTFNIVAPLTPGYDVTTYHYDAMRSGLNPNETKLTTATVNSTGFGKIGFDSVDGKVDAQPLYVSALLVNGEYHNVLFVATEHDSLFAFDADNGTQLWQVSALGANETPSDDHGCNQITPEIGITSTPVIDRKQGANGTIYLVAMTKDANGAYHQRLHALDLTTGAELQGGPTEIQATYPGTGATSQNGTNTFDPGQYAERASLLLLNGSIYMGWTSHCDQTPYSGWIMAYSESTLQQTAVLNLTPNGSEGSVWMSGGGLAADASGNVYVLTANGTFDTSLTSTNFPVNNDFGNAFVKMSTANGTLAVADYYEANNGPQESASDTDLGSGGVLLLPDIPAGPSITLHLAVGAGKDGSLYIINRDAMGEYMTTSKNPPFPMVITGTFPNGVYGSPAYFNNVLYYGGNGDNLKAFPVFSLSPSSGPSSKSATTFPYPGATPSISANGTSGGIVWALESSLTAPGVLHAYDATNLGTELYNSNQAPSGRDSFGNGNKFITPVIVNGKVYVGTQNGVAVFGLLN